MHKKDLSQSFIIEAGGRAVLISFYLLMLWEPLKNFIQSQQPGLLPQMFLQILVIFYTLLRSPPARLSFLPLDWLVTMIPTLIPFLLVGMNNGGNFGGIVMQYAGIAILIGGVISLNTSLGLVPADRGIKSGGLYKFIRHPLFLGYIIANSGILLCNYSMNNFLCVAGGSIAQIIRIFCEERFLGKNPAYADYKMKTRWRLLPYIW